MSILNFPKLVERVQEIAATYDHSAKPVDFGRELTVFDNKIITLLSAFIYMIMTKDKSYWGSLRWLAPDEFAGCVQKVKSQAVGEGGYGKVTKVPVSPCFENVPKSVKQVALKIEELKDYYDMYQSPEIVHRSLQIAKKAADLGIGPKIYDVFISRAQNGLPLIVKVGEFIDGTTWEKTQWKSDANKKKAVQKLKESIETLNKAGIIHHDLHPGNVMVTKSGRVYIIDYDRANFSKTEEANSIRMFNNSYNSQWEPVGVASEKGAKFVYKQLLDEGAILKPFAPAPSPTTNKKTRKHRRSNNDLV